MIVAGSILRIRRFGTISKSALLQWICLSPGPKNRLWQQSNIQKFGRKFQRFQNIRNFWNRSNSDEEIAKTVSMRRICSICSISQLCLSTFSKTERCSRCRCRGYRRCRNRSKVRFFISAKIPDSGQSSSTAGFIRSLESGFWSPVTKSRPSARSTRIIDLGQGSQRESRTPGRIPLDIQCCKTLTR